MCFGSTYFIEDTSNDDASRLSSNHPTSGLKLIQVVGFDIESTSEARGLPAELKMTKVTYFNVQHQVCHKDLYKGLYCSACELMIFHGSVVVLQFYADDPVLYSHTKTAEFCS